jgi:hypothetical protein
MTAVLAVGCQKKDTQTNASFTFSMPTVEGFSTGDAKAYIDPVAGKVKWFDGDQVMIYNLDKTNPANSAAEIFYAHQGCTGQTTTDFIGMDLGPQKDGGFFAFYPADKADISLLANNNRGKWSVGETQTFDPSIQVGGAGFENRFLIDPRGVVMAQVANDFMNHGTPMTMRHIFGFVNLRVRCANELDSKLVKSITIHDKTVHLTGSMELNILDITEARLATLKSAGDTYAAGGNYQAFWTTLQSTLQEMGYTSEPGGGFDVTMTGPKDHASVTINNVKKYFILSLRPGALMNGFDVIVNYADGTSQTKTFQGQGYVVRPGVFTNIDVVL